MHIFSRRSLFFPAALLLIPTQFSLVVAQTNRGTNGAATAANQIPAEQAGYIGRVGAARRALTIILIPTQGNQVTLYYGRIADIPISDVRVSMLDRIGVFPLAKPLSDGIFFETQNQKFYLRREVDTHTPGSIMDGTIQFVDGRHVSSEVANLFEYKGPLGNGK
jgi:hypothetical protein